MKQVIENLTAIVKENMSNDFSGHDFNHVQRVINYATIIANEESKTKDLDFNAIHLGALLHDLFDHKKYNGDHSVAPAAINALLLQHGVANDYAKFISHIVSEISWSSGKKPSCFESAIIQDADRLDAIGAIGIVRCFVYNGNRAPIESSIQHFDDKILHIHTRMNTDLGKKLAAERHKFVELFLEQYRQDTFL